LLLPHFWGTPRCRAQNTSVAVTTTDIAERDSVIHMVSWFARLESGPFAG
jgi:hypothetical protein